MMQKKLVVFMVCVFLIVTGSTTHAELSCKVDGCDTCEPGASCECKKCKENWIIDPRAQCIEKNTCNVPNCGICNETKPDQCLICNEGWIILPGNPECQKLPECNVEHCFVCMPDEPNQCLACFLTYDSIEHGSRCIRNDGKCEVDNCQTCDYCNESACVTCKSGFHLAKDNKCATGSSGDFAAYRVTYLLYFAILLMSAVIVAQKV